MRMALLLGLVLLLGSVAPAVRADGTAGSTVEVRVWQDVHSDQRLYVSARPAGGSWGALGTIRLHLDDGFTFSGRYRHGDFDIEAPSVGGGSTTVELRVSQSVEDGRSIHVGAREAGGSWLRLGSIDLPLDDGLSSTGRYRYGDITIEVPLAADALLAGCSNGTAVPDPGNHVGLVQDCVTLLEASDVLVGDAEAAILNWGVGATVADWVGVTVAGRPPRVTAIELTEVFHGRIPPGLARLDQLRTLNLYGNPLTGRIPRELGLLSELRLLDVGPSYENRESGGLTGQIPPELGDLPDLQHLQLLWNHLEGPIPAEVAALPRLWFVDFRSNRLSGDMPVEFGRPGLSWLYLGGNRLTGEIPPQLASAADLKGLGLSGNDLTGEIPPELGSLSMLEFLWLSDNRLTGGIPRELGALPRLRELSMVGNALTGEIPSNLGDPPNLRSVQLYNNQLTGCVPTSLWDKMEFVPLPWCDAVQVVVPIPRLDPAVVASCASDGAVADPDLNPDLVNDCAALLEARDTLDGGAGVLNWSADTPLSDWTGVRTDSAGARVRGLILRDQGLTGRIPAVLANLTQMTKLSLTGNELTGAIPAELGHLGVLVELHLDDNRLDGRIPAELGALTALDELWLSGNELSGPIPPTLGQLGGIRELRLADNRLSGEIPPALARLGGIELDLRGNQLTGAVPADFADITSFWDLYLWLGGNQLDGCVPIRLTEVIRDRGELRLSHCECPVAWWPSAWGSAYPRLGSDGVPYLPHASTRDAGTYRITFDLIVDIPAGGQYNLGEKYRDDDGRILVRIHEEKSLSYLVLDPFTGEEIARSVMEGPPGCDVTVAALLDSISESARVQPIEIPLAGSGYPVMRVLQPVDGPGTYHVEHSAYFMVDIPDGMRLTLERGPTICSHPLGCYAELHLRDEESGSSVAINSSTGKELSREVSSGESDRDVGALLDSVAASIRQVFPPHLGPSCNAAATETDCGTLLAVAEVMATDAELNWSTAIPLSLWEGVTVDPWSGRVTRLEVDRKSLGGELPALLARLSALEVLDVNGNALTGIIPPELGLLSNLRHLDLGRNELTGTIPPELGSLGNLEDLSFLDNLLTGEIPEELAALSRLQRLSVRSNQLEGCIPAGLERFDLLRYYEPYSNARLRDCSHSR